MEDSKFRQVVQRFSYKQEWEHNAATRVPRGFVCLFACSMMDKTANKRVCSFLAQVLLDYPNHFNKVLADMPGIWGQIERQVPLEEILLLASKRPQVLSNLTSRVRIGSENSFFRIAFPGP